jgi:hypothetical protein
VRRYIKNHQGWPSQLSEHSSSTDSLDLESTRGDLPDTLKGISTRLKRQLQGASTETTPPPTTSSFSKPGPAVTRRTEEGEELKNDRHHRVLYVDLPRKSDERPTGGGEAQVAWSPSATFGGKKRSGKAKHSKAAAAEQERDENLSSLLMSTHYSSPPQFVTPYKRSSSASPSTVTQGGSSLPTLSTDFRCCRTRYSDILVPQRTEVSRRFQYSSNTACFQSTS